MSGENLIVNVMILATSYASAAFAKLGADATAASGILASASMAAVGLGAGIAAIGVVSTVAASSFDQAMHKVLALTKTSREEAEYYKQSLLKLAPALDMDPTSLAKGLYYIISAGHTGADAMEVLEVSAKAAAAGMTSFERVAPAVTSALNAYTGQGLTAGKVTDILMTAVTRGKMEWQNFSTSFAFTAVTFRAANMQLQEAAAAVSRLSQVTGPHTIRRVQMELDNLVRQIGIDVVDVAKRASELGLPFETAKFAAMGFIDKLKYLAQISGGIGNMTVQNNKYFEEWASHDDAWQKTTQGIQTLAMATAEANHQFKFLVGGAAAFIPAAILLSDKGAMYADILKDMTGNGEKTQAAFDKMRESTGQQWRMWLISMQSLAVTIGLEILPAVNATLTAVRGLFIAVTEWLNTGKNMETFKFAILGIAIVIGVVLTNAIWGMVAAWLAADTAGAPFLLIMGAIVAVGIVLGLIIQKVVEHFGGWGAVMKALQPVMDAIGAGFQQVQKAFADAFNNPATKDAIKQLQQALPQLLPVLQLIGIILVAVLVVGFQLFLAILKGVAGMIPGLMTVFAGLGNILGGLVSFLKDLFTGNFKQLIPDLEQIGLGIVQVFGGIFMAVLGYLGGFFGHFLSLWGKNWGDVGAALLEVWGSIVGAVGGFFNGLGTSIHDHLMGIVETVGGFGLRVLDAFHRTNAKIREIIMDVIYFIVGSFVLIYDNVPIVHQVVDAIVASFNFLRGWAITIFTVIKMFLQTTWNAILAGARFAWNAFYDYVAHPVGEVFSFVGSKLNWLRNVLGAAWTFIVAEVKQAWERFVKAIQDKLAPIAKVGEDVKKTISDKIHDLVNSAIQWGANLVLNFAKGITDNVKSVGDAIQKIIDIGKHFLEGRSPPAGWPGMGDYGVNLVRVFSQGIVNSIPMMQSAMNQLMNGAQTGVNAQVGVGVAGGGRLLTGGGNVGTQNVTIQANFPNVTNKDEIKAAFAEMTRQDYAKNRRAGYGQAFASK